MLAPVRNEWYPRGDSVREQWYAAKLSKKDAEDKSKLYENRIGMLHKKRERALRMLESTRAREQQLMEQRRIAEVETKQQHELVMQQNLKITRDHRDARNMVLSARAGCHIRQVLMQDRNTHHKRRVNQEKADWKEERLARESADFAYRKGIHDYIHSTDVANPRAACDDDKQNKLDRTREHLLNEWADHDKALSTHSSKMEGYASLEHSMIENVTKVQCDVKSSAEALEQKYIKADASYRPDRMLRQRLKDQPVPPERPLPFTPRPG